MGHNELIRDYWSLSPIYTCCVTLFSGAVGLDFIRSISLKNRMSRKCTSKPDMLVLWLPTVVYMTLWSVARPLVIANDW